MPRKRYCRYFHHVVQRREPNRWPELEEDKLLIILKFFDVRLRTLPGDQPDVYERYFLIAERDIWVDFSHMKHQLSSSSSSYSYTQIICESLSSMGVPQHEHPAIVHKLFRFVEAAVSPDLPIIVGVSDTTIFRNSNFIPASKSSIDGLQQVRLDSRITTHTPTCAICLEDFAALLVDHRQQQEALITRLPCRHHYHLHCIVQCLEINHLCPMCRYPMPTQD
ncbi:putative transcription factor C2H2 family [Rosa chinensis]|uniref:RING-type E3 ubiquitin transferase n=1 Tax=Rosa chinensis TaxID=74649 RepID=A0A2P6SDE5_ROSCH|nr:putative transcription factor C2H2 family [Rosa chinensis]